MSRFTLMGRGVLDTPLSRGMTVSGELGPRLQGRAAQEFCRLHRRLAGALQLNDADRTLATRDGELIVEHTARLARSFCQLATQDLHACGLAAIDDLAPGSGKRRKPVDMTQHVTPRLAPIDPRLGFLDLGGI